MNIRTIQVAQYITPLREGGSLPAIVASDEDEKFVLKFKGAGQGTKALIAEFIGSELARKFGFLVPEVVFGQLHPGFGMTEGDEEIQDLLKGSSGLNLGMAYLQGAITFDATVTKINAMVASMVVWLDAFITNVDRTARNTNMLMWKNDLWLIDHGASLYFHHNRDQWAGHAVKPFLLIKDHVLLPQASRLDEANEIMKAEIDENFITDLIMSLPQEWLIQNPAFDEEENIRDIYKNYLLTRLAIADQFTKEAKDAR